MGAAVLGEKRGRQGRTPIQKHIVERNGDPAGGSDIETPEVNLIPLFSLAHQCDCTILTPYESKCCCYLCGHRCSHAGIRDLWRIVAQSAQHRETI